MSERKKIIAPLDVLDILMPEYDAGKTPLYKALHDFSRGNRRYADPIVLLGDLEEYGVTAQTGLPNISELKTVFNNAPDDSVKWLESIKRRAEQHGTSPSLTEIWIVNERSFMQDNGAVCLLDDKGRPGIRYEGAQIGAPKPTSSASADVLRGYGVVGIYLQLAA